MATPYESLVQANHDYHEAVNEICLDENLNLEDKLAAIGMVANIFPLMEKVNELLRPYYEEPE